MVGDVIYVHRRIGIVEALCMIFDYSNESQKKETRKKLQKAFPAAYKEAKHEIINGMAFDFILFNCISKMCPISSVWYIIFLITKENFPIKKCEVFALAFLFGYRHYGIETHAFNVVHFTGSQTNLGKDARVKKTSRKVFLENGKMSVDILIKPSFAPVEVANRALGMVGDDFGGYDAFENNCEHFTSWCATGKRDSRQAMWGNESIGVVESHYERLKDFFWDLLGEQANRLRKKAEEDEKYSAELIEILVKKRIEFESMINAKASKFEAEFSKLNHQINSALACEDYDKTRKSLIGMAKLFNVELEHANYEEFKSKMEDKDVCLIL